MEILHYIMLERKNLKDKIYNFLIRRNEEIKN